MKIMIHFKRLQLIAVAIAMIAAASFCAEPARTQEQTPADPINGKRIYLADGCFECHGRVGQGGIFRSAAPALAKTALPLEAFGALLRKPMNTMPAYSSVILTDKDVADIYAFLQSLPGRQPVKDFSILN